MNISIDIKKVIERELNENVRIMKEIMEESGDAIEEAVHIIVESFNKGNKLLLCGNGGSAADAQHIATEFVVRFTPHRERPALPAIALTTDTSCLTAGANDYGFDSIFVRQVEALGKNGDALLGYSTSGNSENVIKAVNLARKMGMTTIGMLGGDGGKLKGLCNVEIIIPAITTNRIQEGHQLVGHILCELVEQILFE